MSTLFRDLEGVVCITDDVLIYGKSQKQRDERLLAVLNRLEESGLSLNRNKCEFSERWNFLVTYFPRMEYAQSQSSGYSEHGRANDCKRTETFPWDGKSIKQIYASSSRNDQATKRLVAEEKWVDVGLISETSIFIGERCPHWESSFSTIIWS